MGRALCTQRALVGEVPPRSQHTWNQTAAGPHPARRGMAEGADQEVFGTSRNCGTAWEGWVQVTALSHQKPRLQHSLRRPGSLQEVPALGPFLHPARTSPSGSPSHALGSCWQMWGGHWCHRSTRPSLALAQFLNPQSNPSAGPRDPPISHHFCCPGSS